MLCYLKVMANSVFCFNAKDKYNNTSKSSLIFLLISSIILIKNFEIFFSVQQL